MPTLSKERATTKKALPPGVFLRQLNPSAEKWEKDMKKLIVLLAVLILTVAAITACGNGEISSVQTTTQPPVNTSADGSVEITTTKQPTALVTTDEFGNKSDTAIEPAYVEGDFVYMIFDDHAKLVSYTGNDTEIVVPATIKSGAVKVTEIGKAAFQELKATKITLSEGIVALGIDVFYNCRELTEVTLPASITTLKDGTFRFCVALEAVTLPDSITSMGDDTFYNCVALKSVKLPATITAIKQQTFAHCSSLETIEIPASVTTIGVEAFSFCSSLKSFTFGSNIKAIGEKAFYDCTSLTKVALSESITYIPKYAFYNCSALTELTLGTKVDFIGSYAFYGCSALKAVTLPESVKTLETGAFAYCTALASINLPANVTTISDRLFFKCDKLASVEIKGELTAIGAAAFSYTAIKSFTIPASVTTLGISVFAYCPELESVTIEKDTTLAYMPQLTFTYCEKLKSIVIPDSIVVIQNGSFSGCKSLESVTLSPKTTELALNAFLNCTALKEIYVPDTVTKIIKGSLCIEQIDGVNTPVNTTKVYAFTGGAVDTYLTGLGLTFTSLGHSGHASNDELTAELVSGTTDQYILTGYNGTATVLNIHQNYKNGTVVGIGANFLKGNTDVTAVTLPDTITTIGASAFEGCTALTAINFPTSLVSIGNRSFMNTAIKEALFNTAFEKIGDSAFENCAQLTRLVAGTGVPLTEIGARAFKGTSLTAIVLSNSLTKIGNEAFANCPSLLTVSFNGSAPTIGTGVFTSDMPMTHFRYSKNNTTFVVNEGKWNGYSITSEATSAVFKTFELATGLTAELKHNGELVITGAVDIPDFTAESKAPWYEYRHQINKITLKNVTGIGAYTFSDHTAITTIKLDTVKTKIGDFAFAGCSKLATVEMTNEEMTLIGIGAFKNTALTEVTIPKAVTEIKDEAFMNCAALTKFTANTVLTTVGAKAFTGTALTTVSLPATVTVIGNEAFKDCALLTTANIYATTIGDSAFENCVVLKSVSIKSKPETIGAKAFKNTAITEIKLDGNVQSIGDEAFANCASLLKIQLTGNAPTLGKDVIAGTPVYCYFTITKTAEGFTFDENGKWNGYVAASDLKTPIATFTLADGAITVSVKLNGQLEIIGVGDAPVAIPSFTSMENVPWSVYAPIITSITFTNISEIGDYAFAGLNKVTNLSLPLAIKKIGAHAFEGCTQISTYSNAAAEIGDYAFAGCTKLNNVHLGNAKTFGSYIFAGCTALANVTINDSSALVEAVANNVFYNTPYGTSLD